MSRLLTLLFMLLAFSGGVAACGADEERDDDQIEREFDDEFEEGDED